MVGMKELSESELASYERQLAEAVLGLEARESGLVHPSSFWPGAGCCYGGPVATPHLWSLGGRKGLPPTSLGAHGHSVPWG